MPIESSFSRVPIVRPLRFDFPRFNGSNVTEWLLKAEDFLNYYDVADAQRLDLASVHLDGEALEWYRHANFINQFTTWLAFTQAVKTQFAPAEFEDLRCAFSTLHLKSSLATLHQQGPIDDHQSAFEALSNLQTTLPDECIVDCGISGVKSETTKLTNKHGAMPLSYTHGSPLFENLSASDSFESAESIAGAIGEVLILDCVTKTAEMQDVLKVFVARHVSRIFRFQPITLSALPYSFTIPQTPSTTLRAKSSLQSETEEATQEIDVMTLSDIHGSPLFPNTGTLDSLKSAIGIVVANGKALMLDSENKNVDMPVSFQAFVKRFDNMEIAFYVLVEFLGIYEGIVGKTNEGLNVASHVFVERADQLSALSHELESSFHIMVPKNFREELKCNNFKEGVSYFIEFQIAVTKLMAFGVLLALAISIHKFPREGVGDSHEDMSKSYVYHKAPNNPLTKLLAQGLETYKKGKGAKHKRLLNPAYHQDKLKHILLALYLCCGEMLSKWEKIVSTQEMCELDVWPYLHTLPCNAMQFCALHFTVSMQKGE